MTTTNENNPPAEVHPIIGMNADDAKGLVADMAGLELDAAEAAEKANPNKPGGRTSVLKANDARREALKPPPAVETPSPEPEGADAPTEDGGEIMPESTGNNTDKAKELLLDVCEKYGVHPGVERRPRELASWRFYPGDRVEGIPDAVVIVTAGGTKLKHYADPNYPVDPETDEKLHQLFGAFNIDKVTKLATPGPLPKNLTLPDNAVTGQVTTQRHRYVGGYLRRKPTK